MKSFKHFWYSFLSGTMDKCLRFDIRYLNSYSFAKCFNLTVKLLTIKSYYDSLCHIQQITGFRHEITCVLIAFKTFLFHRNNNCRFIYASWMTIRNFCIIDIVIYIFCIFSSSHFLTLSADFILLTLYFPACLEIGFFFICIWLYFVFNDLYK